MARTQKLTIEQALEKLTKLMLSLPRAEGERIALAFLRHPQRATDFLNLHFKDVALTDDDVLRILRRVPHELRTAGEA